MAYNVYPVINFQGSNQPLSQAVQRSTGVGAQPALGTPIQTWPDPDTMHVCGGGGGGDGTYAFPIG